MKTINLTTNPIVDAYVNYIFNKDKFIELLPNFSMKYSSYSKIAYNIFVDEYNRFYSKHENLN